jgi:hypothetical protein
MWAIKAIDREAAGKAEKFLVNSGPLNYARIAYTRTRLTNGLELIAGGMSILKYQLQPTDFFPVWNCLIRRPGSGQKLVK